MRDTHISQLEARLENLIEGAFAHFFGRKIRAQDIALQLARAMEDGLRTASKDDPRPIAPDNYQIRVGNNTKTHLLQRQPNITTILSEHLVDLATSAGYRLESPPIIELKADEILSSGEIHVTADHLQDIDNTTNVLDRVAIPTTSEKPLNPQLVIGNRTIFMEEPLINVGRSPDNHIILDDKLVSRHHAQIRLRFGRYTLFDVQSRSGTFVNDIHVKEHTLHSGDVIRMGDTRLFYVEDDATEQTDSKIKPLPPDETP